jgi:hypothetical protein
LAAEGQIEDLPVQSLFVGKAINFLDQIQRDPCRPGVLNKFAEVDQKGTTIATNPSIEQSLNFFLFMLKRSM